MARDIVGDRTKVEELYDDEVVDGLRCGDTIMEAIAHANAKFPDEALVVDDRNVQDVTEHYTFMLENEKILKMVLK